jgi:hypothetical protein
MGAGDKHYAGRISGAVLRRNLKDFPVWSEHHGANAKEAWFVIEYDYALTAVFNQDDTISHFELKPIAALAKSRSRACSSAA